MSDTLDIQELPDDLRRPILVLAFFGWNDAAEAATDAVKALRNVDRTPAVARIDPDDFFVFTEHRPTVKWVDGDNPRREIIWPQTDFTLLRKPHRDLILGLGSEPDLRWSAYCRLVMEVAQRAQVEEVVTLGALLADVAHTRPIRVNGGSSSVERSRELGFESSRYEGPTGIVGAVGDACRLAQIPHLGFWASVPHYVTSKHNPAATKALLQQLDRVYELNLDLDHLDSATERYRAQIDRALSEKPDIRDYVRSLEEQADSAAESSGTGEAAAELESQDVLDEVDRLLRGES